MSVNSKYSRQEAIELFQNGNSSALYDLCIGILRDDKHDAFATANLGLIYARSGRYSEAIAIYRDGLYGNPNDSILHINISRSYQELKNHKDAYWHAKKATEIDPHNKSAWLNLSFSANILGICSEAVDAANRVIKLDPSWFLGWNCLGNALKEYGAVKEAIEAHLQVIQLAPSELFGYTNTLLTMQFNENLTAKDIVTVAKEFAGIFEKPFVDEWGKFEHLPKDPYRKLKVGFASPDFSDHPVMYFFEPLLARLNRKEFEIVCFFMYPEGSDDHITKRVKLYADEFVYLGGKSVEAQVDAIKERNIDILIDLAGHTAKSAITAMARKPAPVQMTWMGYPGTTGLKAIDYRITDMVADVEMVGEMPLKEQYTEKLVALPPPFCVYRPSIRQPLNRYMPHYQIRPTPAISNGYITFGNCNNIAKLTEKTLAAWGKILKKIPSSKLLIEGKGLDNDKSKEDFIVKCERCGVERDNLILISRSSKNQYLTYHQIDIALDPFPLTGGTTTFDTLWMGVPLVSMAGSSFRSRMGVSILTAFEKNEWIAKSEVEYIDIACSMADNIELLNKTRLNQRQLMIKSPLMGEGVFAEYFGDILRKSWFFWCAKNDAAMVGRYTKEQPVRKYEEPIVFLESGRLGWGDAMQKLNDSANRAMQIATVSTEAQREFKEEWREARDTALAMLNTLPFASAPLYVMALLEENHANLSIAIGYMSWVADIEPQNPVAYKKIIGWYEKLGNIAATMQIRSVAALRGVKV